MDEHAMYTNQSYFSSLSEVFSACYCVTHRGLGVDVCICARLLLKVSKGFAGVLEASLRGCV